MRKETRCGNVTLWDVIRRECDMWHVRAQSLCSVLRKKERKLSLFLLHPHLFLRLTFDISSREAETLRWRRPSENWKKKMRQFFYLRKETFPTNSHWKDRNWRALWEIIYCRRDTTTTWSFRASFESRKVRARFFFSSPFLFLHCFRLV